MAQHHEEQFREAILAIIAEGVMIIDASDIITAWNPAAVSIFDITPSAMLGKRYQDVLGILPQALASCLPEMLHAAQKIIVLSQTLFITHYMDEVTCISLSWSTQSMMPKTCI